MFPPFTAHSLFGYRVLYFPQDRPGNLPSCFLQKCLYVTEEINSLLIINYRGNINVRSGDLAKKLNLVCFRTNNQVLHKVTLPQLVFTSEIPGKCA